MRDNRAVGFACSECKRIGANGSDLLARRKDQEQRAWAISELGASLSKLGALRAMSYKLAPLELSTASMRIGRRFDDTGDDAAAFLDATIDGVIAQLQRVRAGDSYDMDFVHAQMAKLRDGLAADASLDDFDRTTGPTPLPEDVRQLVAYRAYPVQTLALFVVTSLRTAEISRIIDTSEPLSVTRSSIGFYTAGMFEFGSNKRMWKEVPDKGPGEICTTSTGAWRRSMRNGYMFHTSAQEIEYEMPDVLTDVTPLNPNVFAALAVGDYFAIIFDKKWFGGSNIVCLVYRVDRSARQLIPMSSSADPIVLFETGTAPFENLIRSTSSNGRFSFAAPNIKTIHHHATRVAIDAGGNIWHLGASANWRTSKKISVRNSKGDLIKSVESTAGGFALASGAEGVWLAVERGTAGTDSHAIEFANYRLVPPSSYQA